LLRFDYLKERWRIPFYFLRLTERMFQPTAPFYVISPPIYGHEGLFSGKTWIYILKNRNHGYFYFISNETPFFVIRFATIEGFNWIGV
jgi:hypothetical protein